MKRVLLTCCLIAATCAIHAQTTPRAETATSAQKTTAVQKVSREEFLAKVDKLDKLMGQNKIDKAKIAWGEINNMMNISSIMAEYNYDELEKSGNKKELTAFTDKMNNQGQLRTKIILLANDLPGNKSELNEALKQFAENLL